MMATRAPKQWSLTTTETLTTYTNWKENLVYTLSLDFNFAPLLVDGYTWADGDVADRGFVDDAAPIAAADRKSKGDKAKLLTLMLGQIANFCNVITRHQIVYESTSLDSIWELIREHYGFNVTGSRFFGST